MAVERGSDGKKYVVFYLSTWQRWLIVLALALAAGGIVGFIDYLQHR